MKNLSRANIFWFIVVLVVLVVFLALNRKTPGGEEIDYPVFVQKVEDGLVQKVTIRGQQIEGTFTDGKGFETTGPEVVEPVHNLLVEHAVVPAYEEAEDSSLWLNILFMVVPIVAMVFIFLWFMRNLQSSNGRAMSFGKSKAKLLSESSRQVTFADVAGIEESKDELREVIDFLKDPRKFTRLGGRIPKGVLLMGPPGTGKTLLARAVAGEAGVPFYSISGSDFVEMFVGVGASRVRDLFEQGKRDAPCIIFIDEIDAVGRHRGAGLGGGHDEREQTLNQLLVEMDGFEGTEGVILVAATNRPDVLDPALLRPGRFDRRVVVPSPDVKGRQQILEVHTRKIPLSSDVDLSIIAKRTPGFSGADLENLCNEAALLAARADKESVEHHDFETARDKVMLGPERRSMILADHERMSTAIHEAGHAIVAHLLPDYDPVHKVTIIPRGRALGVTAMLPDEDRKSWSRSFILKNITMAMGGRAAEKLALGMVTSGARSDIQQATKMARHMVCDLGMSDDLGPVAWGEGDDEVFLGKSMAKVKSYSERTAQRIDDEIKHILTRANDTALHILSENHHVLQRVADALMERETLEGEEFAELVEQSSPRLPGDLQWLGA